MLVKAMAVGYSAVTWHSKISSHASKCLEGSLRGHPDPKCYKILANGVTVLFDNCGQTCIEINHLIIFDEPAACDGFVKNSTKAIEELFGKDPRDRKNNGMVVDVIVKGVLQKKVITNHGLSTSPH